MRLRRETYSEVLGTELIEIIIAHRVKGALPDAPMSVKSMGRLAKSPTGDLPLGRRESSTIRHRNFVFGRQMASQLPYVVLTKAVDLRMC
jgi:hypothetical protein